jgi:hypothetical protein
LFFVGFFDIKRAGDFIRRSKYTFLGRDLSERLTMTIDFNGVG